MLAQARLAYRLDFLVQVASDVLLQAVGLIFIAVVFTRIDALAGWRFDEVLFIYGFFLIPFALFNATFAALSDVGGRYVVGGELDRVLVRPVGSLLQVQLELLRPQALHGILVGVAVLLIASARLDFSWKAMDVVMIALAVVGAWLVYGGVYVGMASVAFWTQDRGAGPFPIAYNTINFARYPLDVYPAAVRFLLTFVLPYGFVAFYPSAGLLREDLWWLGWSTLPVGSLVFMLGWLAWQRGVAHYEGAGS